MPKRDPSCDKGPCRQYPGDNAGYRRRQAHPRKVHNLSVEVQEPGGNQHRQRHEGDEDAG